MFLSLIVLVKLTGLSATELRNWRLVHFYRTKATRRAEANPVPALFNQRANEVVRGSAAGAPAGQAMSAYIEYVGVERYRSPVEGMTTTISLPADSGRCAT